MLVLKLPVLLAIAPGWGSLRLLETNLAAEKMSERSGPYVPLRLTILLPLPGKIAQSKSHANTIGL
jgi:hypothetical protein